MPTGARKDPYTSFRYKIEIEGLIEGGFSEASGLQATTQVEDFREGGVNDYVHKLPKETTYQNITLKRGLADCDKLWNWLQAVISGKFKRRNIHLFLVDNQGKEKWRWEFNDAYPVKWSGPEFKSDSNTVAFETLELVHNGFKKY